jgi:hypothetical protein
VRFRAPTCVHGDSEPFLFEMRTVFSGAPCIGAPGNAGAPMGMGYATTPLKVSGSPISRIVKKRHKVQLRSIIS